MSPHTRSWLVWLLPFVISGGMALGALVGMTSVSDAAMQEGPAGDMAGATGALMIAVCIVVGFVMATLATVVATVLGRGTPSRIALRFGLSVVTGGAIGALGSSPGDGATGLTWLLLLGAPVLLTWSSGAKAV